MQLYLHFLVRLRWRRASRRFLTLEPCSGPLPPPPITSPHVLTWQICCRPPQYHHPCHQTGLVFIFLLTNLTLLRAAGLCQRSPRGTWRRFLLPAGQDKSPSVRSSGGMMSAWRPGRSRHSLTPVIYDCFPPLDTSAAHTHADSSRLAVWERCLSVPKHEAWLSEASEGGKLHRDVHWMDVHAGQRQDRWLTQESVGDFANLGDN